MKIPQAFMVTSKLAITASTLLLLAHFQWAIAVDHTSSSHTVLDERSGDELKTFHRNLATPKVRSVFVSKPVKGGERIGSPEVRLPTTAPTYPPWYNENAKPKCNSSFEYSSELQHLAEDMGHALDPCLETISELVQLSDSFATSITAAREQYLLDGAAISSVISRAQRSVSGITAHLSILEAYYPKAHSLVQLLMSSIKRVLVSLQDKQSETVVAAQKLLSFGNASDGFVQIVLEVDEYSQALVRSLAVVPESIQSAIKCTNSTGVCAGPDSFDEWNRKVIASAGPLVAFSSSCTSKVRNHKEHVEKMVQKVNSVSSTSIGDELERLSTALHTVQSVTDAVARAVVEDFNDIGCCFLPLDSHKLGPRLKTILTGDGCSSKSKLTELHRSSSAFVKATKDSLARFPTLFSLFPEDSKLYFGSLYPGQNISVSETCFFQEVNFTHEAVDLFIGLRQAMRRFDVGLVSSKSSTALADESGSFQNACEHLQVESQTPVDCCAHFRQLKIGMVCSNFPGSTLNRCSQCETGASEPSTSGKLHICAQQGKLI